MTGGTGSFSPGGIATAPKELEPPAPAASIVYVLNASNRCDACGHRAYVEAWKNETQSFLWCGHHWKVYCESLVWYDINDETEAINQKLDASA